jgi:membrane protein required for colicin V production
MTWVDAAVLGVLALSAMIAFLRGLVREVLGVGAWIGAALVAIWGAPLARPQIAAWIPMPEAVAPVAFGGVFLITLILLIILSRWIAELVQGSILSGLDRSLGLVFGIARGALLIMVAYILVGLLIPPDRWPAPVLEARSLPYVRDGAAALQHALPEQYRPKLPDLPIGREATAADLLHAIPLGRATNKPFTRE